MAWLFDRLAGLFVALWRGRWRLAALVALICIAGGIWIAVDFSRNKAEAFYDDPIKHFKYGSTGGDQLVGIPVGIFKALPQLCREHLPGEGWQSLGFLFEEGMERPIGTSLRRSLGFERVSLNCAACHVGTYRATADAAKIIVPGMPANNLLLGEFVRFLENCALDERFNPWQVMEAAEAAGARYGFVDRLILQYLAVPAMKEFLILARHRFRFLENEPAAGPGRFDTFNPAKALLNWRFESLPPGETIGIVDYPSLWLQGPREGMQLHWDGNNDSVPERNRSAAFGTGAVPTVIDRESLGFIATWLSSPDNRPPPWPFAIDRGLAARGAPLYAEYCAACHGKDGRDFSGARVGKVEPIERIATDPCRLENYSYELSREQGNLYSGFPEERFRRFRKTDGYANAPLDGIWLRAPYLHNGSVPTIRDLLEPVEKRPRVFYRGYDVVDRDRLGFIADVAEESGRRFFRYETQCVDEPALCARAINPENRHDDHRCVPSPWAGNSNRGHEGPAYGTHLSDAEKDAIVEFLKTF